MPAKKRTTKAIGKSRKTVAKKAGNKVAKKAAKKVAKKAAKKVAKKDAEKRARHPQGSRQIAAEVSKKTRHAMIAEAAYYLAEKRNFANGDPVADWLSGEKAVDLLLSKIAR